KIDIPSTLGIIGNEEGLPAKRVVGQNILIPRKGTDLQSFLKDGLIDDWDAFEDVMSHMLRYLTPEEASHHPILFSEPSWNTKSKREKIAEILFEKFKVPAFYIAKNAALTCFANGRHTGLVLDCGAIHTSAVPVYDGLVLTQEVIRSPLAGDFIVQQAQRLILDELKIEVVPYYRVASKEPVNEREPAKWKERTNLPPVSTSYENYMLKVSSPFACFFIKKYVSFSQADTFPMVGYEFPNGFNFELGHERFQIPEALFDPSILLEAGGSSMLSMSHIVASSISMCDIDIRPSLYSNIIVVGGNSLITGFTDRLQRDLNIKTPPSMRLKVNFPSTTAERRYSSWIGGSILGSLSMRLKVNFPSTTAERRYSSWIGGSILGSLGESVLLEVFFCLFVLVSSCLFFYLFCFRIYTQEALRKKKRKQYFSKRLSFQNDTDLFVVVVIVVVEFKQS
ncbi:actin-like protein 6A, partial [Schistosoma bovis]